jgi:D-glutamate cyclase
MHLTDPKRALIDQIEALIHEDVGRNVGALFAATRGNLARAASALAADPAPRIGLLTGFYVPLGHPPAAETDGPVGTALLAAGLDRVGVACRVLTDAPCATGCAAALQGAGLTDTPLDVVELGAPLSDAIATWRDHRINWALAIERCGRSADGAPRNMRGVDISPHTVPLDELFVSGPWDTMAIGDGGNELGLGSLPRDLVSQNVANGDLIACVTPAHHLIMAGVSHWGCYALLAALAVLRRDWKDALLDCLSPAFDGQILDAMIAHGPAVDGVSQLQAQTIDAIDMATHHQKMQAITALIRAC